jgi:hypothetical protein
MIASKLLPQESSITFLNDIGVKSQNLLKTRDVSCLSICSSLWPLSNKIRQRCSRDVLPKINSNGRRVSGAAHAAVGAPGHDAEAVVLDLVNPAALRGRLFGRTGKTGLDEGSQVGQRTLTQHGRLITAPPSDGQGQRAMAVR